MSFSSKEDAILVEFVEQHPVLYDLRHPHYKNHNKRENVWEEVGEKTGKGVDICKRRWRNIRDTYNRHKRERKVGTGSAAQAKRKKWDLAEVLSFLDIVDYERQSPSNIASNESLENSSNSTAFLSPNVSEYNVKEEIGESSQMSKTGGDFSETLEYSRSISTKRQLETDDESETPNASQGTQFSSATTSCTKERHGNNERTPTPRKKGRLEEDILKHLDQRGQERNELIQILNESSNAIQLEDEIDVFFKSMAMSVKKLPPVLMAQAKMNICRIVSELELRALQLSPPSPESISVDTDISEASSYQSQELLDCAYYE